MARNRTKVDEEDDFTPRLVEDLPERQSAPRHHPWVKRLDICVKHPRRWAEVHRAPSNRAAQTAVDNLDRRKVIIPHPDHEWKFHARGVLVIAQYGGQGIPKAVMARRRREMRRQS